ncbi:LAME_0D03004g1_1 [Lachancea meyersii CBS 8951]|uniref:Decapping nuclease n=1 Tax=Lachancea meyersii CBS 8951 TaxID=1266667 RepID=A0A1G4J7F3_9SACH|nr:LAME_0D03004g1_1 [Lachancea meyersii CBS 8951]
MAEDLAHQLRGLDLGKPDSKWEVNCKRFQHTHPSKILSQTLPFFRQVEEVGVLTHFIDSGEFKLGSHEGLATLKDDVSNFVKSGDRASISNYLGHNMLENYESFTPVTVDQLEDMGGLQKFIKQWTRKKDKSKLTIVCSRHNMIDLIMVPFSDQDVHLNAIHQNGYLYLFPDRKAGAEAQGIHSKDSRIRKICYSGFELESLVTDVKTRGLRSGFYSIVCGQIDPHLEILFKAEMDALDSETNTYTEIKCSTGLKTRTSHHRRKLLRMWVQTSLIPSTSLLVGIKDPYYNQLTSFERYTRTQLYRKFNNTNLKFLALNYNYNANVSVQWFQHIMKAIQTLVEPHVPSETEGIQLPTSFKITLTKDLVLMLQKLDKMPPNTVF